VTLSVDSGDSVFVVVNFVTWFNLATEATTDFLTTKILPGFVAGYCYFK
jgi:hypothetical protein